MKIGNFEIPPKKKTIEKKQPEIKDVGNPELAKNKEIYSVLTDPAFIKTFPGPANFQYSLLHESLISSPENASNGIEYLKNYLKKTDDPLFCLTRFSQFLHTALGNQKNLGLKLKEQEEIALILEQGFREISTDPKMNYFLSITLKPEVVLESVATFSNMEKGLTPIQISNEYFIQDNGFDPIPIFYETKEPKYFKDLIEEQSRFFENARPENRSEMPKNPTLKEMKEYKDKFLNTTIHFEKISQEIREKIKNATRRLKPEELQNFFPQSKNTYELTQDPLMFEFRAFINPEVRSLLQEEFNINFDNIPIKEQVYFLTSISNRTNETIIPVKNFSKKFGSLGLKTFLSIEQGGKKMGDKILELGKEENLPEEVAREIFTKYGEIIDEVDHIVNVLEEKLKNKLDADPASVTAVKENLLKRAKNLLEKYADNLKKDPGEIISELNNLKTDNIVFLSIFQSLHDTKNIKFEDLKDFEFSNHWLVTEKEEIEITEIINKNYKNAPNELRETVLNSFLGSINGIQGYYDNIDIYQLKYKDKVAACCKLDYKYPGEDFDKKVYFGSFNVDPDFANGEIGSAMLERTVDEVAKSHIIEADCNALSKIGAKYIESGFVAEDFYDFHGWPSFRIIRDDKNKEKIVGKNLSKEEILSHLSNGLIEKSGKRVEIVAVEKPEDFTSYFSKLKMENKIVSRYFYDNESKKWIIVIEPNFSLLEKE